MRTTTYLLILLLPILLSAQQAPANWYLLDPQEDGVYGTSVTRAYDLLNDRIPEEVIVRRRRGGGRP